MDARLIVSWLIVGIPLCWGIEQTMLNVVKLFQ